VAELTGPERIREAIARDRGHFAFSQPVTLCGQPDGTEVRADAQPVREIRTPLAERLAGLVQCPSCLGLRFGPVHLSKRLLIGRH
jgi:hypothetical protein